MEPITNPTSRVVSSSLRRIHGRDGLKPETIPSELPLVCCGKRFGEGNPAQLLEPTLNPKLFRACCNGSFERCQLAELLVLNPKC